MEIFNDNLLEQANISIFPRIGGERLVVGLNKEDILFSHAHHISIYTTVFHIGKFVSFGQISNNTFSFANSYDNENGNGFGQLLFKGFQKSGVFIGREKRDGSFANCHYVVKLCNGNNNTDGSFVG